jgi:ABC-type lipoprotein release transport system permease subunit
LDPVAFAVAPAVLLAIAIAACLLPAARAASTDPADALRCEENTPRAIS